MSYHGRFAPSPTGHLHFGSLVAAVGSWLCARHAGGQWLLRVEDIDPPREMPGSTESILAALPAFGLMADAPALFQSKRIAAYDQAFEQLRAANQVFPCWCSRNDLDGGLHLDGACLASPAEDRTPAWRLRVPDMDIGFDDALQGRQTHNLRSTAGDFVIRRVEGYYAYQLACVVDDAFQGITQVVRGNDLLDSTPRQIYLQRCLGLSTPTYLHLPLALDASGRKLSKTERAHPVDPTDPMPALRRALAFLDLAVPPDIIEPALALAYALDRFAPEKLPHCSERAAE
ncbi:tRNA glutamyl-Q(34) synthetase GluQRS [Dyella humicola]|uniref:tRNA glutamyl-Q(34) synthetase GluQRS n=1 Tax=Dyella humicola TaxID=2992126 RepID=UPI00224FF5D1|nr:tRNA glutamyl-Q(34) synthetase GluQRS [Dyella humicola]